MMAFTRRIQIDPPGTWIEVATPPLAEWDAFNQASGTIADHGPSRENLAAMLDAMRPLILAHNLSGRDGKPLEIGLGVSVRQIVALQEALTAVYVASFPTAEPMN